MKMNQILKQAQQLQKELKSKQDALADKVYEASSGGGMVTVQVNGKGQVLKVQIDPEVVVKEDVEMLEDLVVSAVNGALSRAQEAQQDEMSSMMGGLGLNIPGLS